MSVAEEGGSVIKRTVTGWKENARTDLLKLCVLNAVWVEEFS